MKLLSCSFTIVFFLIFSSAGFSQTCPGEAPSSVSEISTMLQSIDGDISHVLPWPLGNGVGFEAFISENPISSFPENGESYYASNSIFGTGEELSSGVYSVYYYEEMLRLLIDHIQPYKKYYVKLFEYDINECGDRVYNIDEYTSYEFVTSRCRAPESPQPEVVFSNISDKSVTMSFTRDQGNYTFVTGKKDYLPSFNPNDGSVYSTSLEFGKGPGTGSANNRTYRLYFGESNSIDITCLEPDTEYGFEIRNVAYNEGVESYPLYGGSQPCEGPFYPRFGIAYAFVRTKCSFPPEPTSRPSSLWFSNITDERMTLNWNNGNGGKRVVIIKEGSAVNVQPTDGSIYTANSTFGSGQSLGSGNYVVYNGSGSSFTLTNLDPATEYHFAVFEYNENTGCITTTNYLTTSNLTGSATTLATVYNPTWTDKFRILESFPDVINTNISTGWKSSAASTNRIPGNTDGYLEYTVTHTNRHRMIGFSENNYFDGTWRNHWETIEYNLYLRDNGTLSVYESALSMGSAGSYAIGDVIKIERIGGSIYYKVNGQTRFTSSCPYSKSLIIDFCLEWPNDYLRSIKISQPAGGSSGGRIASSSKPLPDLARILENAEPSLSDSTGIALFSTLKSTPNPTSDIVRLSLDFPTKTDADVIIYSSNGGKALIRKKWQLENGTNEKTIDIKNLTAGHYIVKVIYGDKEKSVKIVKL